MPSKIQSLFASDITREIEEVIKVDQTDEEVIRSEIDEYIVTRPIGSHYEEILDSYFKTPNRPHEGVGIWVSGFFGSGKSSFAKMLGLAIENRSVQGEPAGTLFGTRTGNQKVQVLLTQIAEQIPTHAVIFDVSTDRGIRSGNQTLTEIMYRLFLDSLGYSRDLDLAELEIGLEEDGDLEAFKDIFNRLTGKSWDERKGLVAFAMSEASAAMHELRPQIHDHSGSWADAHKGKADITPGKLADRVKELTERHKPGHSVLFVVDEVGQFVARDVQKMLDLQAIVQQLGVKGRGKYWLAVTSQEKLNELVSGLDDTKIELARLMDRFPLQVHLEPSDISEVTSRRVLAKNADAQSELGSLFDTHRGRLTDHTRMSADIALPELSREAFIDLYPLLPYQVDLIIQVVSGLRTQGGASRHVGGANRTIIKLAQQLLINPAVNLGEQPVGQLARLDQVYDLVENNIGSELRGKIVAIGNQVEHPLAQSVAKVICLLQFVKSVHRTPENIAAALFPAVDADARVSEVQDALRSLEEAKQIRKGEDGYRIPTPAEDVWDRERDSRNPNPSDTKRLHREVLAGFWSPQPSHTLLDVKSFKAGLQIDGRDEEKGDLMVRMYLGEVGPEFDALEEEMRTRSQQEVNELFWVVPLSAAIDDQTVQLYRSREMISKRSRDAKTPDEARLVAEERSRERRHLDELKRLLRSACLGGSAYFRGNDRSPADNSVDVGKAAAAMLAGVLPDVFSRFDEGAAKLSDVKRGVDALLSSQDLQGLPAVFPSLGLVRSENGKTVLKVDSGPLHEVLAQIDQAATYGTKATGRSLADRLADEPYGWDFDTVKLFVLSLLRAEQIEVTHQNERVTSATSPAAKEAFGNNNHFRTASFQPRKALDYTELVKASENFMATFGSEVKEIAAGSIVAELQAEIIRHQSEVESARDILSSRSLPGAAVLTEALSHMRTIQRSPADEAISTFNSSFQAIKDGIRRAADINRELTDARLEDLQKARSVLTQNWPFLETEPDLAGEVRDEALALQELLDRETFFRELVEIFNLADAVGAEYQRRSTEALDAKLIAYKTAVEVLHTTPGWDELSEEAQAEISAPLTVHSEPPDSMPSITQLRSDRDACTARLQAAIEAVHRTMEGERLVTISLHSYFAGGVETEEQLDAALQGIREECERLIGSGKKIIVR